MQICKNNKKNMRIILIADPISEVKVGDVGKWFGRRNFGWAPFTRLVSRSMWRYRMKYVIPKRTSLAPIYHMAAFLFLTSYIFSEHHERSKFY